MYYGINLQPNEQLFKDIGEYQRGVIIQMRVMIF